MMYADLIGKPFRYGGRGNGYYDCYGLLAEMYKRVHGIILPSKQHSAQLIINAALMGADMKNWEEVEFGTPERAILIRVGKYACHVGFSVSNTHFIHTWERSNGVCVERLDMWGKQIVGFYHYVGK